MTVRSLRVIVVSGLILLAELALINMPYAAEEPALEDYSVQQLTDLYVDLTFAFEGNGKLEGLSKWPNSVPVKVMTFPRDSIFDKGDRFREIIDLASSVATSLDRGAGKHVLEAYGSEEMVNMALSPEARSRVTELASIFLYVGSRGEIKETATMLSETIGRHVLDIHRGYLSGSVSAGGPLCYGVVLPEPNDPYTILRAWVFIEDTAAIEECLYEEIMQSFGLFNDLPAGAPSMFNDDMVYNVPTPLDWFMWRLHLDSRLRPGMSESEVRAVAPQLISDLLNR